MARLKTLTRKEIRLVKDMVKDRHPLYKKANLNTLSKAVINIFELDEPLERIINVPGFKQILFKTVIDSVTFKKNKHEVKLKRILKK